MCSFPAQELLRMRRQLVKQADASGDEMFIRQVAEFVRGTDIVRISHFELTDCECWARAVQAEDAKVAA